MASRPIAIAPAPDSHASSHGPASGGVAASPTPMAYTCQNCIRRKVRCDKLPVCSSCSRTGLQCFYDEVPPPRTRKRKRIENVQERLIRYEQLLRENGILDDLNLSNDEPSAEAKTTIPPANERATAATGTLVSGQSKSRYISSSLWRDLGEEDMREISEGEESEDANTSSFPDASPGDPLSGALLGATQDLEHCHPAPEQARALFSAYTQNVDPLCKVLHAPTVCAMVETVIQQPQTATKAQSCLLFAIYHCAAFSMTGEDCMTVLRQTKIALTSRYRSAVCQALVNASWLKTTDMQVLQALVLFLVAVRTQLDPNSYWILTGVAVRVAQRMGLHRDGENLGLPPFEVEMRRRLFYQLIPLDGFSAAMSGTGISIAPNSWDTKQPANVNDSQIFPGMTEYPPETRGATDMLFYLARAELSKFYTRTGVVMDSDGAAVKFKQGAELDQLVDEVENILESKYLRYCDILDPVHVLVLAMTRSAMNAARLRNGMCQLIDNTITKTTRRDLCRLAQKVLDTQNATYSNPNLKNFLWQVKGFSLWYPLMCMLTSLAKVDFFTRTEVDQTWRTMEEVFANHSELLQVKDPLNVAISRLTLRTWEKNPASISVPEPPFIIRLRSAATARDMRTPKKPEPEVSNTSATSAGAYDGSGAGPFSGQNGESMQDFSALDFNVDEIDWGFWNQLVRDYQTTPDQQ